MVWLVAFLVGPVQTGIYAACQTLLLFTNPVILGFGNLLGPRIAQAYTSGGKKEVLRITNRGVIVLTLCMAFYSMILFVAGDALAVMIFGREYAGHGLVIAIMGLCAVAWGLNTAVSNGLAAIERSDVILHGTLVGFVAMMITSIPLVLVWEILGAAVAMVIGAFAKSAWNYVVFQRLIHDNDDNEVQ